MKTRNPAAAKFISFEGIDGCGKSTLMLQLSRWLDGRGVPHISTREPGGTPLGESIRNLLLDTSYSNMDGRAEVLLYTASRAQLATEIIVPALKAGKWVLTDRYVDATLAYQGYGRGLDLDLLRAIQEWATKGLRPDYTVLLDCGIEVALGRLEFREGELDRMEQESVAFHKRVREGYLRLAESAPERFVVIGAERPLPEVVSSFEETFIRRLREEISPRGVSSP